MQTTKMATKGLGRGLDSLLEGYVLDTPDLSPDSSKNSKELNTISATSRMQWIDLEAIQPNPIQPRTHFDMAELQFLADSISEQGILQPILVRLKSDQDKSGTDLNPNVQYQIVAGERRWRAAKMAQQKQIPVIIKDLNDQEVLEIALIENIQRQNLNPVEEAEGYQNLMERFGYTQERLSKVLGRSRSHVANIIRLLSLPEHLKAWLREGKISAGHARALLASRDPDALARDIMSKNLSVRDTEEQARQSKKTQRQNVKNGIESRNIENIATQEHPLPSRNGDADKIASDLSALLGVPVELKLEGQKGQLVLQFKNFSELNTLLTRLSNTGL